MYVYVDCLISQRIDTTYKNIENTIKLKVKLSQKIY